MVGNPQKICIGWENDQQINSDCFGKNGKVENLASEKSWEQCIGNMKSWQMVGNFLISQVWEHFECISKNCD